MTDLDFTGKTAIVTGAAHGFGRAIAEELFRRGARVAVVDILADELTETEGALRQIRPSAEESDVLVCALDVGDDKAVAACVERVLSAFGRIDILVNNAGGVRGQTHRPVEQVETEDWHAIFDVNLHGAFYFIRSVAPHMKQKRFGRIINISSGAGRSFSLTGIQAYASAKAGQIGLTRQMARELGAFNITVNNVAPGFVRSNPATEKQWHAMGEEGQKSLLDSIALHRLGTAEEIASAVMFFASDLASYISGQTISVDGGSHMF